MKKEIKSEYKVLKNFIANKIYIIVPFKNHVRFFRVYPEIFESNSIIEFMKGNPNKKNELISVFTAYCEIVKNKLVVKRSEWGQIWETEIDLSNIKVDKKNFNF